jgi:PKD repeat protein
MDLPRGSPRILSILVSLLFVASATPVLIGPTGGVTVRATVVELGSPPASSPSLRESAVASSGVGALQSGAGPAGNRPESCSPLLRGGGRCGFLTGPSVSPSWYNVTGDVGGVDPTQLAALAWDPTWENGTLVYFGGCEAVGSCPDNSTWIYQGYFWDNVSGEGPAPPPLAAMSMDWDPLMGGIVLAGGYGVTGYANGGTWLFANGSWMNITGTVGGLSVSPSTASGALAWDPAVQGLVYVGGCDDLSCGAVDDDQWTLTSGAGWEMATSYGPVFGESLAYDAADQELIAFGGSGPLRNQMNTTWAFADDAWANLTASSVGCFLECNLYPAGRTFASMTWDSITESILLVGGLNSSSDGSFNDSWSFAGNSWAPFDLGNSFAPPPEAGGAMPVNSSGFAPVLVAGGSDPEGDTYVLETPPRATLSASPNPADTGSDVVATLNASAGTGSGPWVEVDTLYGNSQVNTTNVYGVTGGSAWTITNSSLTYSVPGVYPMEAAIADYFYIEGTAFFNLTVVAGPVAHISIVPTTVESGFPVTFDANVSGGVGPYSYDWSFGDGNSSRSASPAHSYASAGMYGVTLIVADAGGGHATANLTVDAAAGVVAHVSANVTSTDAGLPVSFTGSAIAGTGPYGPYVWSFGGGATASGTNVTYSFATANDYPVTLNVTDSLGFVASATVSITVNPDLSAGAIGVNPSPPVVGSSASLTVATTGGTGPFTYAWSFGDGSSGTGALGIHAYAAAGTYSVSVTVTDSVGQKSSSHAAIAVKTASSGSNSLLPSGTLLYLVLGVGVVLVALVALLLLRRSRRPPTSMTGTLPAGVSGDRPPPPAP